MEHVVSHNARAAAREGAEQLSWKYPLYHGGLRLWEVRRSLRVADHCVMLNEGDRAWARDHLRVPGDRISVMPNAIAPHFVSAPDVTGPGEGPLKLAFVGGWISRKGTAELVEAMRLLDEGGLEFSLDLLGTGQSEGALADFPAQLRDRISVTPRYANEDLPRLLAGREILVFPSHSEGSSVALLEAMASGLAPLATRVGSAAETIDQGDDGRLVESGDAPAVAQAVKEMAVDRRALADMRARRRRRPEPTRGTDRRRHRGAVRPRVGYLRRRRAPGIVGDPAGGSERGWRRRPLAGVFRLRPPVVEHTPDEGELLRRMARGATWAVEIGVAEGGSARDLRQVLDPGGALFLIDPYPSGRLGVNMQRLIARRAVGQAEGADVSWMRGAKPGSGAAFGAGRSTFCSSTAITRMRACGATGKTGRPTWSRRAR